MMERGLPLTHQASPLALTERDDPSTATIPVQLRLTLPPFTSYELQLHIICIYILYYIILYYYTIALDTAA